MTFITSPKLPLFVPGHRADIVPKAAASGADMVIIDLEAVSYTHLTLPTKA